MSVAALAKELPKKILIGHLPYTIKFHEEWIKVGEDRKWGTCDHSRAEIEISNPSVIPSNQMLVSVFVHELFHALWYHANLPDKPKEEAAVSGLEFALTTFIKNNPKVMLWIMKGLK